MADALQAVPRRLSIVLPAYNEEAQHRGGRRARRGRRSGSRRTTRSSWWTTAPETAPPVVERLGASDPRVRLVRHRRNRGYGEALRSGFEAATLDLIFFIDADNQFDPSELERFLPLIDRVDVVAGYRINRQRHRDASGRRARPGTSWSGRSSTSRCATSTARSSSSAASVFDETDLESVGAMVSTELMVKLGRAGYRIVEVGVHHYPRTAGEARGVKPHGRPAGVLRADGRCTDGSPRSESRSLTRTATRTTAAARPPPSCRDLSRGHRRRRYRRRGGGAPAWPARGSR